MSDSEDEVIQKNECSMKRKRKKKIEFPEIQVQKMTRESREIDRYKRDRLFHI